MNKWLQAFRLRTLPLALASIGMGTFLATTQNHFNGLIFSLSAITTVLLQVLSNLANDYGDTQNGADNVDREGPSRAVQTGEISKSQMKNAIVLFIILSLVSGTSLLFISFGLDKLIYILSFLLIGLLCIAAAIKYTAGKNPYGYAGLGDISVLLFFGIVGVIGSCFLFTNSVNYLHLLPAFSLGLFSTGVLNVNNIRDINSDKIAGKKSIPVRLGQHKARIYHWSLLIGGMSAPVLYTLLNYTSIYQFVFVISFPLFIYNGVMVQKKKEAMEIDPYLKQLALSTVFFTLLFGVGLLI